MAENTRDVLFKIRVDGKDAEMSLKQIEQSFGKVGTKVSKTGKDVEGFGKNMERSSMIGMNMNRIVQDSAYFAQSASFGFMAVGNNIQMFAESMALAKSRGQTFKDMMMQMVTGVNGYMLAINLAISGLMAWSMLSAKSASETKKLKEEVDHLKGAFDGLTTIKDPFANMTFNIDTDKIPDLLAKSQNITREAEKRKAVLQDTVDYIKKMSAETEFNAQYVDLQGKLARVGQPGTEEAKKTQANLINMKSEIQLKGILLEQEKAYQDYLSKTLGIENARSAVVVRLMEDGLKPTAKDKDKDKVDKKEKQYFITIDDLFPRGLDGQIKERYKEIEMLANPDRINGLIGGINKEGFGGFSTMKLIEVDLDGLKEAKELSDEIRQGAHPITFFSKEEIERAREIADNLFSESLGIARDIGTTLQRALGKTGSKFVSDMLTVLDIAGSIMSTFDKIAGIIEAISVMKAASATASMATTAASVIANPLSSFIGLFNHNGGIINNGTYAHNGRMFGGDEVGVIARRKEMILTPDQQAQLFSMANNGIAKRQELMPTPDQQAQLFSMANNGIAKRQELMPTPDQQAQLFSMAKEKKTPQVGINLSDAMDKITELFKQNKEIINNNNTYVHNGRMFGGDEVGVIAKRQDNYLTPDQQAQLFSIANNGGSTGERVTNVYLGDDLLESIIERNLPNGQKSIKRFRNAYA